jgi:hypothetical protein
MRSHWIIPTAVVTTLRWPKFDFRVQISISTSESTFRIMIGSAILPIDGGAGA